MKISVEFPYFWVKMDESVKTIDLFGLNIKVYYIILALALVVAWMVLKIVVRENKKDERIYLYIFCGSCICGMIMGRFLYVCYEWGYYSNHFGQVFVPGSGNCDNLGFVIGGILFAYMATSTKENNIIEVANAFALPLSVFMTLGGIGLIYSPTTKPSNISETYSFFMLIVSAITLILVFIHRRFSMPEDGTDFFFFCVVTSAIRVISTVFVPRVYDGFYMGIEHIFSIYFIIFLLAFYKLRVNAVKRNKILERRKQLEGTK